MIQELITHNTEIVHRLTAVEGAQRPMATSGSEHSLPSTSVSECSSLRARSAPKSPADSWYHGMFNRLLLGNLEIQKNASGSTTLAYSSHICAFSYLVCIHFNGAVKTTLLKYCAWGGRTSRVRQFLRARGSSASSVGIIVKALTKFERVGALMIAKPFSLPGFALRLL